MTCCCCCWEKSWFQQSRLFWKESKRIVCNSSGRSGGKNLRSWSWVKFRETNILISQRREAKRGSSWEGEERLRRDWKCDFWEEGRPVFLVFQRVERIWFSISSDFMHFSLWSCCCTSCSILPFSSIFTWNWNLVLFSSVASFFSQVLGSFEVSSTHEIEKKINYIWVNTPFPII